LSLDLKKRGFRFVGSTICYAHMLATGMVNDHAVGAFAANVYPLVPGAFSPLNETTPHADANSWRSASMPKGMKRRICCDARRHASRQAQLDGRRGPSPSSISPWPRRPKTKSWIRGPILAGVHGLLNKPEYGFFWSPKAAGASPAVC
jgi:hypothetical protein